MPLTGRCGNNAEAWTRFSAGEGAKATASTTEHGYLFVAAGARSIQGLLIRRRLADGEPARYLCFALPGTALAGQVAVAGRR